jgi:hypothetical protein
MAISLRALPERWSGTVGNLPLVLFRIAFGAVMCASFVRFIANGWVERQYIAPEYHFTYPGFGWVEPLPGIGMVVVFGVLVVCALGIMLGAAYRLCIVVFAILFAYVQLIDATFYLNHYYLVALLSILMIGLPLNRRLAVDSWLRPALRQDYAPTWMLDSLRLQVGIVYVFAGIAKLQSDWLLDAMPLRLWLPPMSDLPIVGSLLAERATAYAFSWAGAIYDLSIPFLLLYRRTRLLAFAGVVVFHLLTALLFPVIGLFPWIMMAASLLFLPANIPFHLHRRQEWHPHKMVVGTASAVRLLSTAGLILFFALQLLLPLRHWLYPGDVLWTEEGFRLSWRVMLVDKAGDALFFVRDPASGRRWQASPSDYLTRQQEAQMSFQPDMILQFAHFLERTYRTAGYGDLEVYAEVHVAYNGRPARLLIDPQVDLTRYAPSFLHKPFILPY